MKVHFKGFGQLNGVVIIDKIIDLDKQIADKLTGAERYEIIQSIISIHYPGVAFEPGNIGYTKIEEKKEKKNNDFIKGAVVGGATATALNVTKKQKSNSINKNEKSQKEVFDFTANLSPLLNIPLKGSKEEIQNNLDRIYIALSSHKWPLKPINDKTDIGNSIMLTQVYRHYKLGIRNLRKIEPNKEEIKEYLTQSKKLTAKKVFNQYGIWIILVIGICVLMSFAK